MSDISFPLIKTKINKELDEKIRLTVNSLFHDMRNLDPLELNISEYNQRYLENVLLNLSGSIQRYAYILGESLSSNRKSLSDTCFIEYGGGTGFLSLLAKRLGIGIVIYNDIYDVSCKDAEEIARVLGCRADYYVEGDIDDLVLFCKKHDIRCDSMGSYDVIEHIYDIDDFLRKLPLLSMENTTMFHASSVNMFFYPCVRAMCRAQRDVEIKGSQREWGWKEIDCLSSFRNERKKLVRSHMPSLSDDEVERLTQTTRGLMQKDIVNAVDNYMRSGELPILIEHPTNTGDPYTGNWNEHLMNPYYLKETLTSNGFSVKVLPLPWHEFRSSPIRNLAAKLLNLMIRISDGSLYFSAGYALYAQYNGTLSEEKHTHHIYKYHHSYLWWYCMLPFYGLFFRSYDLYERISKTFLTRFGVGRQ
ncbi:hypothetical protein MUP77_15845 [Candidatus Bathyarchaeota archaeon]|nr:hypothetical protein [Candidatus Bathyarchaeota archaeon]